MRRSLEHGTWAEVHPDAVDRAGGDRSSLTDRPELLVRVRDCETLRPDASIPLVFSTTSLLSAGYPSLLNSPAALVFKSGILAINGMATLLLHIFSSTPFSLLSQLHYVMVRQCWSKLPIVSNCFQSSIRADSSESAVASRSSIIIVNSFVEPIILNRREIVRCLF